MRTRRLIAHSTFAVVFGVANIGAQQGCPGLPTLEAPTLKSCSGFGSFVGRVVGLGCAAENDRLTSRYERMTRGFASGLEYQSGTSFFSGGNSLEAQERTVAVDTLRGCRGENVNILITPGNITSLEYQLTSPSGVLVANNRYGTLSGDVIMGENISLPETGYYTLLTRTTARAAYKETKRKDGSTQSTVYYPRKYQVGFRSDANATLLQAGDKLDATINAKQPFIRRVLVKGGTKVRFRFASQGTGDFLVVVRRESGEELYRNTSPTGFYESRAFTPKADETFRLEVRPWYETRSAGVQVSIIDDKATGEPITAPGRVAGSFKLPAHFSESSAPEIATSETVRFLYSAAGPENLSITVRPSQLAGLAVRVRAYNEESEEVTVRSGVLSAASTLPFRITSGGTWIIEVTPTAATELAENGEAKYVVELARASAGARPARPSGGAR